MSGNSGGGGAPFIEQPKDGFDCQKLFINTGLASPISEVLEKISVGDVLRISAQSDQGPIVAIFEEDVAGTIITSAQVQLLRCISQGNEYVAEVVSIEEASCEVQIRPL